MPKTATTHARDTRRYSNRNIARQLGISAAIILLIAIFLITKADTFSGTFYYVTAAPAPLMVLALILTAGTYGAAAISYVALGSARGIRLNPTLVIQTASGITNRLLPAGLGGAGLYLIYMKRSGYSVHDATAIVAANNIFGAAGNVLLMALAVITTPGPNVALSMPNIPWSYIAAIGIAIVCIGALLMLRGTWRRKAKAFVRDTLQSLRVVMYPGKNSLTSLSANITLTILNGIILTVCIVAVGADMYWPLTIVVLSLGALLGAAVPTPGGVGGVEAGMLAGLVACGVPAAPALAATLLYRAVTYWIPIIPGLIVLPWVRKHYLY